MELTLGVVDGGRWVRVVGTLAKDGAAGDGGDHEGCRGCRCCRDVEGEGEGDGGGREQERTSKVAITYHVQQAKPNKRVALVSSRVSTRHVIENSIYCTQIIQCVILSHF